MQSSGRNLGLATNWSHHSSAWPRAAHSLSLASVTWSLNIEIWLTDLIGPFQCSHCANARGFLSLDRETSMDLQERGRHSQHENLAPATFLIWCLRHSTDEPHGSKLEDKECWLYYLCKVLLLAELLVKEWKSTQFWNICFLLARQGTEFKLSNCL